MTRANRRSRRLLLLLALALTAAGLTVAGPTGAAAVEPVVETLTSTSVDGSCGFRTTLTSTSTVSRTVKPANGKAEGFPLVTEQITYKDTYADPASGATLFTVRGNFQFKVIKAKPLGGDLYEVTAKDSGLRMVVQDATGRPRGHDSGVVTYKYVADKDGNGVDFISSHSPGPTPDSKCGIVGSFRGTDSASRLTAHPKGTTDFPQGFYEYLPPGYDSGPKKPLLLFFHGFGGSGDGSAAQLPFVINDAAIPLYISTNNWPADRPFVMLAPQHNSVDDPEKPYDCPDPFAGTCVMAEQHHRGNPDVGSPCTTPAEVENLVDYAISHYRVDPSRVYLTGLSCGGYGVWEALPKLGNRVAAAVPIAGNGLPSFESSKCSQWTAPIWAFHGGADDVVHPDGSIETVQALRNCVPPPSVEAPKLTVYPGVDHNSWDRAYTGTGDDDVFNWMLGFTAG